MIAQRLLLFVWQAWLKLFVEQGNKNTYLSSIALVIIVLNTFILQ
jgi:hypothetical protein